VKMIIKKVKLLSLAKVVGLSNAFLGVLFGLVIIIIPLLGLEVPLQYSDFNWQNVIFMPFVYAVGGFFVGLAGGAVFNLATKVIGGVEVETE